MLKRLPSIPTKSVSFQQCKFSRTYKPQPQLKLIQNSFYTNSNTLVSHSTIQTNLRCTRFFTTAPTKDPAPETKSDDATDQKDAEDKEGAKGKKKEEGDEEFDEFFDDSAIEEEEEDKTEKFVEFQDTNMDQRREAWKFLKKPNPGFTSNYKKIKAAFIGLPEAEMADTVAFPLNYRNKSGIATKQGRALPQFAEEFKVPEPRYGINVEIFLNKIGKDCGKFADKFKSWDELMTFKRKELKKLEIPVKQRRWIRSWVEKYRRGIEPYAIRMKSIAKRNKEKKKEQVEAYRASRKQALEKTKAYRQKTAPLRLERKRLMRRIKKLTRAIRGTELRMKAELAV